MDHTANIIKADTIEQYNRFFGFETRHPLVGVVYFDGSVPQLAHRMMLGFYALFLKKTAGCVINYGKTVYDFDDETVVSFAPGQTIAIYRLEDGPVPEAVGLLFLPAPHFIGTADEAVFVFLLHFQRGVASFNGGACHFAGLYGEDCP